MKPVQIAFTMNGKRSYWRPKPENLKDEVDKDRMNQLTKNVGEVFKKESGLPLAVVQAPKYVQIRGKRTSPTKPQVAKSKPAKEKNTEPKEPEVIGDNGFIATPTQIENKSSDFVGDRFIQYANTGEFDDQRQEFFLAQMFLVREVIGVLKDGEFAKRFYCSPLSCIYRKHQWSQLMCDALPWLLSFFSSWDRPLLLKRLKAMRAKLKTQMLRLNKAEQARSEEEKPNNNEEVTSDNDDPDTFSPTLL